MSAKAIAQQFLEQKKRNMAERYKARKHRDTLLAAQDWKCAYCGRDLHETGHHIDHMKPLSLGGSSDISNLRASCPNCNHKKGAKLVLDKQYENDYTVFIS